MVPRQQGLRARLRDPAEGSTQCCTGVLLYFVALKELPKEELTKALDRAVFDRREIEELRTKANGYWGIETSEERILAAQW